MNKLYQSPLRVYLCLGLLALVGIWCGLRLPISLFPNSSKPEIVTNIPYDNLTPEEFLNTFGKDLEEQLRRVNTPRLALESVEANYKKREVEYLLKFKWGVPPQEAQKEVQTTVNAFASRLTQDARDGMWTWIRSQNAGFLSISFYSDTRSLDDLYDLLQPALMPKVRKVNDANNPVLFNPSEKEIRITLIPEVLASLQLLPRDIDAAIAKAFQGNSGGSLSFEEINVQIEMPRQVRTIEEISRIVVSTPTGKIVHLGDIAHVDWGPRTSSNEMIKTSGTPSLILFATPRPGANVKRMSEQILQTVEDTLPELPKDVHYRVLVDPSEFIRSAVNNVIHEVAIAALLAVGVLFLFIGSFKNVITAAIEIPLSMVLAFILMRLSGINLNLISLGGLALSAGMNVDASVVVMENIFRHLAEAGAKATLSFADKTRVVAEAVKEVAFPIIGSTLTSLVVFLPLTFTSGLSFAILGDLAFAVVFSHGFSAIVALILVPTVRLHLMRKGVEKAHHAPIEKPLSRLESLYERGLRRFIDHPKLKWSTYGGLVALLLVLVLVVLPRLRKEIVGLPDTDWIVTNVSTEGNAFAKQMESTLDETERSILDLLGNRVAYTFTEVHKANEGTVMARLKNKKDMKKAWDDLEHKMVNTPFSRYDVGPWNPSELPIPDPPQFRVSVFGPDTEERNRVTKEISDLLEENKIFSKVITFPNVDSDRLMTFEPHYDQWDALARQGTKFVPADLADLTRVATRGRRSNQFPIKGELMPVILRFPTGYVENLEDVGALPIGVGSKIVALKSLVDIKQVRGVPTVFRVEGQDLCRIDGRLFKSKLADKNQAVAAAKKLITHWQETHPNSKVTISYEDAEKDLNDAISQLSVALALSVGLIFFALLIQFGNVFESLVILVSVPLGFIGVLTSLWVFDSTLSLNSILGVILLNGIAVANSIILVDFTKRLVAGGMDPEEAVLQSGRKRMRPILITSLTSILGMVPIAFGFGEGGRILQPLGIAVSGGLWVSTMFTLFLVPSLHTSYLRWAARSEAGVVPRKFFRFPRLQPTKQSLFILFCLGSLFSWRTSAAAPEAPVTFLTTLDQIIARSPEIGVEHETLEVVDAKNLPSSFVYLPKVSLSASQGQAPFLDYDANNDIASNRDLSASASVNLFRWGADVAALKAANLENKAQKYRISAAELKVEGQGVMAIIDLIQNEKEAGVLRRTSELVESLSHVGEARYKQGLLPSQELEKVNIDLENARAELTDSEIRINKARATLRALLGHDRLELEWPLREVLMQGARTVENGNDFLKNRPDVLAAVTNVEAYDRRAEQSWGKMLPSLDLSVSYTYGQRTSGPSASYLSGMVNLRIPIFDGLENLSDYRAQVHSRQIAQYQSEQVNRDAKKEWEIASRALKMALETAQRRETTLASARRIYADNLKRFQRGFASANDLANEQTRFLTAESLAIKGWAAAHISLTQLCHSLGMRIGSCLTTLTPTPKG